jgi:hypothetical protein
MIVVATASYEGAIDYNANLGLKRDETLARLLSSTLKLCADHSHQRLFVLNLRANSDPAAGPNARMSAVVGFTLDEVPSAASV